MSETANRLEAAGLPACELRHIECLSDKTILGRAGLTFVPREKFTDLEINALVDNANAVVRYFRAWADILEEQLGEQFETRELLPISKPVEA